MANTGADLIASLREPSVTQGWSAAQWTDVLSLARRELMLGHLAASIEAENIFVPDRVNANLIDALREVCHSAQRNKLEAERLRDLLAPLQCPVIVLKGSAYTMGGIQAGKGRLSGDLDILVPRDQLDRVETRLIEGDWVMQKTDPYDLHYYRNWMHELPPMQHSERGNTLDMHHTIMPLTARLRPNAAALIAEAVPLADTRLLQLCPADQVLHSAVHLFHDGDMTGGLRNLHDVHRLLLDYGHAPDFWETLKLRTQIHGLGRPLFYALRYCISYFRTATLTADRLRNFSSYAPARPIVLLMDRLIEIRFATVNAGPHTVSVRFAILLFYIRSHWIKMPPRLLLQHLWTKWRMH